MQLSDAAYDFYLSFYACRKYRCRDDYSEFKFGRWMNEEKKLANEDATIKVISRCRPISSNYFCHAILSSEIVSFSSFHIQISRDMVRFTHSVNCNKRTSSICVLSVIFCSGAIYMCRHAYVATYCAYATAKDSKRRGKKR